MTGQCDDSELKVGSDLRSYGIKSAVYYEKDSNKKRIQYAKSQGAQISHGLLEAWPGIVGFSESF
jgi:histidyl-tRNA synthetase